jgi:transcriptional regulator with XRE-family HTH domain
MSHLDKPQGISYYNKLNEAAPSITPQEWAFFHLLDGISDAIAAYMNCFEINQAELARRMNAKPSLVSRLLSGDNNPSLKTLSKVFFCLDAKLEFQLVPANSSIMWFAFEDKQSTITYQNSFICDNTPTTDLEDTFKPKAA